MANLEEDMNVEAQLQVAFSTIAELRDQNAVLNKTIWSLEERLRMSEEGRADLKRFYENQMDALRADQQELIDAAVSRITESFEAQIARLTSERDAARLSARSWRGRKYGRSSERNAGHDDGADGSGENRESEKADFVSPEAQARKESDGTSATTSDGETVDVAKEVSRLKRRHPGAEVSVERVDYSKACRYMSEENMTVHPLEEYFTLSEGEYYRTGKDGEIERSWYRIIVRHPERYEQHIYEAAHVRSRDNEEYKTTSVLDGAMRRPIGNCVFGTETLSYVLCEKYLYHTPFRQIARKLRHRGLSLPKNVLEENIHKAIGWMSEKLKEIWMGQVRKSWIWMVDETRTLVGCTDEETRERRYKNKYMWGIRANSVNLAWFIYENGSRGAEAIRPFLDGFIGFYTTDSHAVYKIFDSARGSEREAEDRGSRKSGRRSACMVHIRRGFVDAIQENRTESMWFMEEIGKLFSVEHRCMKRGLKGTPRLLERLKEGSTADIMSRIEDRLEVFRQSGYAGCGEMLKKALRYATGEWPAMRRVLEDGDVELSNNLSEQMMRSIKMNLKNAGNIGSEESARHSAFMFSVIESCRMCGRSVERYLTGLLERLKAAKDGDDLTDCLPCFMPA